MSSSASSVPAPPSADSSSVPTPGGEGETQKHYTTNVELYDGWASTYDTDGNILPMVDDLIFNERVLPLLSASSGTPQNVLEIGCGTGRNTVKIKKTLPSGSTIYAIDVSEGMMNEAKKKIYDSEIGDGGTSVSSTSLSGAGATNIQWALIDVQTQRAELSALLGHGDRQVDIVISTLVLEHVGLDAFFSAVGAHLRAGGWAWISSMHPFIGANTGAGYRRSEDNKKVHGVSYNYEIQEVVDAAKMHGLEVEGEIVETGVGDDEEGAVAKFGARAKKAVGWKIFVGFLFRKTA